jgi:hypothetical protein
LEVPGLASLTPEEWFIAEWTVESMHAFPTIQSKPVQGFGGGDKKNKGNKKKGGGQSKGFGI